MKKKHTGPDTILRRWDKWDTAYTSELFQGMHFEYVGPLCTFGSQWLYWPLYLWFSFHGLRFYVEHLLFHCLDLVQPHPDFLIWLANSPLLMHIKVLCHVSTSESTGSSFSFLFNPLMPLEPFCDLWMTTPLPRRQKEMISHLLTFGAAC
jgi:hypothetical protein